MTLAELCDLPVAEIADENAVLFLWTTSPLLEESFTVINAWGFKYKASFVWDKVKHNMGHYNSVRHEFLLIATKGSCQPENQKLFDSVVSEERTEHSAKPDTFRNIIETLYPSASKVELFARKQSDGWSAWGNQA
jgi:N6-adenosine-specific RNA methylase IME4